MLKSGFIWANINIQSFQSIAGNIVGKLPVYSTNQEQLHGLKHLGLIGRRGRICHPGKTSNCTYISADISKHSVSLVA